MANYEKFEEWMVGKVVECHFNGENGVVLDQYKEFYGEPGGAIWVRWGDSEGDEGVMWTELKDVTFVEEDVSEKESEIAYTKIPWEAGQVVWDATSMVRMVLCWISTKSFMVSLVVLSG